MAVHDKNLEVGSNILCIIEQNKVFSLIFRTPTYQYYLYIKIIPLSTSNPRLLQGLTYHFIGLFHIICSLSFILLLSIQKGEG